MVFGTDQHWVALDIQADWTFQFLQEYILPGNESLCVVAATSFIVIGRHHACHQAVAGCGARWNWPPSRNSSGRLSSRGGGGGGRGVDVLGTSWIAGVHLALEEGAGVHVLLLPSTASRPRRCMT